MKKHVVAATLCTLGLCTTLAGCGAQPSGSTSGTASASSTSSTSNSSQPSTVDGLVQNSILRFFEDDGSRRLVQDMKAGKTPTSCTVLYDEDGKQPVTIVTNEDDIKKLYELVGNITVANKSDQTSTTSPSHFVSFKRQDGSTVGFRFQDKGNLARPDSVYVVDGDEPLWEKVRELQGNAKGADGTRDIVVVSDADGLVTDCPASATAGETVRLTVNQPLDVQTVVRVNGEEVASQGAAYEFAMPDRTAQIEVFTEEYSGGGGS